MLAAMPARRVPPLAIAIALIAAALVATTWVTRGAVDGAFTAARDGEALAIEQAVRGDLVEIGEMPDAASLEQMVKDHPGLRYIAIVDLRGRVIVSAGSSVGSELRGGRRAIVHVGRRIRIETRAPFRHARPWGGLVIEVEPLEADALRSSATASLAIGGVAAVVMLGVAIALVRRELRRRAEEQVRERERRLASLGEMSAVLAHEIKNPLASLKGNAQLLASAVDDKHKPKAARVVDETVRLEKLVTDLLAFVRTGELKREPVAPASIVPVGPGGLDGVEVDAAAAPATWSLDDARMRQVLGNLVENAQAAGGPVRVRVAQDGRLLVFEVADRGPGVPLEDRDKIFEPFFTKKTRGTGLGLAVARRVVEAHGGTIRVADAPGGGALFRVEIPEA
jgi:two-component system sensor histidine kinase HydH